MVEPKLLYRVELFDGLDNADLKLISKIGKIVEVGSGEKIFTRGEKADKFYVVKSGTVHLRFHISILLSEEEIDVDIMDAGEGFGWSALVPPHKLTLSALATQDCELIQIRGKDLLSLCAKRPHMGYVVMSNLAKVIGSRMDRIQHLLEREIELNVPSMEGRH